MPSRRFHTKSRHGCTQCKIKRIKCDVRLPVCSNCERKKTRCQYSGVAECVEMQPEPSVSTSLCLRDSSSPSSPFSSIQPSTVANINAHICSNLHQEDIRLLQFYSAATAKFLSETAATVPVFEYAVLKEAMCNDFLMHELLGFAAVHLINTHPEAYQRYHGLAMVHQSRGLAAFIPQLGEVTLESCNAVFAFSAFIMITAWAFPSSSCAVQSLDPIDAMVKIFQLQKGSLAILKKWWDPILDGALGPLIRNANGYPDNEPLQKLQDMLVDFPLGNREALELIVQRILTMPDGNTRDVYTSAVYGLARCLRVLKRHPRNRSTIIGWQVSIDPYFITLLGEREPIALAILANYAVVLHLHTVDDRLWSPIWGRQLVTAITTDLGAEWEPELRWAVQTVHSDAPNG